MTSDRRLFEKFTEKMDQHHANADHLRTLGWEVKIIPIIMTYSGVLTTSFRQALTDTNLPTDLINSTINKPQQTICDYNLKIIHTRRFLINLFHRPQSFSMNLSELGCRLS
jgi:hypothetical protein